MSKVTIEITVQDQDTNIVIQNPSGKKDDPAFVVAVLMFTLFQDYANQFHDYVDEISSKMSGKAGA